MYCTYLLTYLFLSGLEPCPLRKSDCNSLDSVVKRFSVKLFMTNSVDILPHIQFNFFLPSDLIINCTITTYNCNISSSVSLL